MDGNPGIRVRPPRGKCAKCEQNTDLWPHTCPGREYHVCPNCVMTDYCSDVFECPKADCKREWSPSERQELFSMCLSDLNFRNFVGDYPRFNRATEAWCYLHSGIIGIKALATGACPYNQCSICRRCSAYGRCACGYESQYREPPECPGPANA